MKKQIKFMKQFGNLQDSKQKNRVFNTIIVIFFCVVLYSCAVGSSIITGNVRPAISENEVKIYIESPTKYETIGIVEASCDVGFSNQATQDRVIKKLKSQAAKIGSNGLLLTNTGSQSSGMTGFYVNGVFFSTASRKITAQGKAIFVIQE
ncbi:MAG: hypothetical protein LBS69_01730 [Prevotellaceae bacterium]|jgi:hypothetical protein|nr:hypothetical protein [Prevotellaceae bacterium]